MLPFVASSRDGRKNACAAGQPDYRLAAMNKSTTIDWRAVVSEIKAHGHSGRAIARLTGMSPQAVSDIHTGTSAQPVASAALRLLALQKSVRRAAKARAL